MKSLKKVLAFGLAVSVLALSGSAFAAVEGTCTLQGGDATFTASYDASANSLTATAAGAKAGEQMTFLILDNGTDVTNILADNILYIDQKEATSSDTSFTGVINLARVSGATTEMPAGTYPVRFGYYNASGNFQIGLGNLVVSQAVVPAVESITTDATGNATAGTPLAITATVAVVGGASQEYTWAVTSAPAGATATVTNGNFVADKVGTYVVTATSTFDNTKTATKTITVVDSEPTLTSASIDGDAAAYTDETVTLTGSFVNSGKEGVTLTWSVSGNATLSAETGATTVVAPTATGEVTVTLTATSETGVVVTDTHTITFTERPAAQDKTITIKWGDINGNGLLDPIDVSAVLLASLSLPGDVVLSDGVNTIEMTVGDTVGITDGEHKETVKWGDINGNGLLDPIDVSAVLLASLSLPGDVNVGSISMTVGDNCGVIVPAGK